MKSLPLIAESKLQLIAHNGSGFDIWTNLNTLPTSCITNNPIEISKGSITVKTFDNFCDNWKTM